MNNRTCFPSCCKFLVVTSLLLASSCDLFEPDTLDQDKQVVFHNTEVYILPGKSSIIDFNSLIDISFIDASLVITQQPNRGELRQLESLLFKYSPSDLFTEGQDQFLISVKSEGKIIKTETITISLIQTLAELPCTLIAIEDKAKIKVGSSLSANILDNDRICGMDADELQVSIQIEPKYGVVNMIENSIIMYTPESAFVGHDELIYKLFNKSDGQISYGILEVTVQSQLFEEQPPKIFDGVSGEWNQLLFNCCINTIHFIDNETGFVGGSHGTLLRTTDGGVTWEDVSVKTELPEFWWFTDIFFPTANTGYVTAIKHVGGPPFGQYELLNEFAIFRTNDGGETWVEKSSPDTITYDGAMHFFSSLNGLVTSGSRIYKTTDGGESWKLVANSANGEKFKSFRFFDSSIGFVLQDNGELLTTTNEGESWVEYNEMTQVITLAITGNSIFAARGSRFTNCNEVTNSDLNTMIWNSTGGMAWEQVISLENLIALDFAFSPSGTIGFMVGISKTGNECGTISSLVTTTDSGVTWNSGTPSIWAENLFDISIPSEESAYFLGHSAGFTVVLKYTAK